MQKKTLPQWCRVVMFRMFVGLSSPFTLDISAINPSYSIIETNFAKYGAPNELQRGRKK